MFSTSMELAVTAADRVDLERVIRASTDSEFEQKAADIIALYLIPPERAAVFCMDEEDADPGPRPPRPCAAALARPGGAPESPLRSCRLKSEAGRARVLLVPDRIRPY